MNCIYCSGKTVKNGKQRGIQRYRCKSCQKNFQSSYRYHAYKKTTNPMIRKLLCEGCGVQSVGRILKISKDTVLSRLLQLAKRLKKPSFKEFLTNYS